MADVSNTRSMPLLCNVCPKRPDFSDVSHLLTHAASKGHLSNYYRMKVKASQDAEARRTVAEYDAWYEEWKVDDLMRERMSQKEKKRALTGQASRRNSGGLNTSSRSTSTVPRELRRVQNRSHLSPMDSPRDHRIKAEPSSRSVTPSLGLPFDPTITQRGYAPPMPSSWITPYDYAESVLKQESISSSYSDESFEVPAYNTRHLPRRGHRPRPSVSLVSLGSQPDEECQPTVTVTDSSKLKGVYWPGMAMFDAALPEARRKRNQKKASSVLQHLQTTSETVEPTEFVFDRGGALRKQRTITGHPDSDDSPIEGESSPLLNTTEKKRARRTRIRPALTQKNPNNSNLLLKRSRFRTASHPPRPFAGQAHDRVFDDDDDNLTYVGPRSTSRRVGLSIHRDNSGPEITFNNPAPFNLLTAGFRDPFNHPSHDDPLQSLNRSSHYHVDVPYTQRSSLGFNGSIRPTTQPNPASQSFPTFGHYISHTFGHMQDLTNISPSHVLPTLEQQLGLASQMTHHENHILQPHNANRGSPWNMFGFENQDISIPNTAENAFQLLPDGASANTMFLDANGDDGQEDDQATVSAPSED